MRLWMLAAAFSLLLLVHPAHATELRIASWNIANLASGPGVDLRGQTRTAADYAYLRDQVRILGADILALQEIGSIPGAKAVLGDGYEVVFETRCLAHESKCLSDHDEIYTAIAYRKELGAQVEVFHIDSLGIDHTDECNVTRPVRGSVGVKLAVDGRTTWIPSVHMKASCKSNGSDRPGTHDDCLTARAQFDELANWIKARPAGDAVIVTGDMNRVLLEPTDKIRKEVFETNFTDVQFLPPLEQRACWDKRIDFSPLKEQAKANIPELVELGIEPNIYTPSSNFNIDFFIVINAGASMSMAADQIEVGNQYRLENPSDMIRTCEGNIDPSSNLVFADAFPSDHCPILMSIGD